MADPRLNIETFPVRNAGQRHALARRAYDLVNSGYQVNVAPTSASSDDWHLSYPAQPSDRAAAVAQTTGDVA